MQKNDLRVFIHVVIWAPYKKGGDMYGVKVRVKGKYACFTRPEFKTERVSFDVMTPSSARGILEAIHWKPAIVWRIDRIHVLNPIRFDTIRRNEVGSKIPMRTVQGAMKSGGELGLFVENDRQQRGTQLLRDVDYVIEAHFDLTTRAGQEDNQGKHLDIFNRRLAKGQCHHMPCLGCREFAAEVMPLEGGIPVSSLVGETDLGWMLYDLVYPEPGNNGEITPQFFRARMLNGIMQIPAHDSEEVVG